MKGVRRVFIAVGFVLTASFLGAQEADLILPEAFREVAPFKLTPEAGRKSEAMARYLEAIFEEESEGPDRALETKRQVLALDPGFTSLAIEVANQYLRRGDSASAIAVLKDGAKAAPQDSDCLVGLSGIYLRQLQKPELAEKFALQALAVSPDSSAPYLLLFEIYKSTGQNARAEGLFARALKRASASASFWLDLADLQLRSGARDDFAGVLAFLERAQSAAGDDAETLVRVGDYFVLCSRLDRALPLYELGLKFSPEMQGLRDKLVICYLQSGDSGSASRLLEEMVKDNPLDLRAYDQLADLQVQAGDFSKALSNARQALLIASEDPRRYLSCIQLAFQARDVNGALDMALDAERRFPEVLEFTLFKALALGQSGRSEEALGVFEQILVDAGTTRPTILNAEFFFSYGVSAEQAGRHAKAAELLKRSIEVDPENSARACNYLGYMWADRNENLDEAEALIRRAVAMEPDNGAYADSLGWVLYRKGKYAEALRELLHAAALLKEDDAVVFEHIGDAHDKLGQTAEAVLYWQKALQMDPENHGLAAKLDKRSAPVAQKPAR